MNVFKNQHRVIRKYSRTSREKMFISETISYGPLPSELQRLLLKQPWTWQIAVNIIHWKNKLGNFYAQYHKHSRYKYFLSHSIYFSSILASLKFEFWWWNAKQFQKIIKNKNNFEHWRPNFPLVLNLNQVMKTNIIATKNFQN